MVESRLEPKKLSARDRLRLIQTLNMLVPTQFDEIVFALDPPGGVVPDDSAPQGKRSKALLDWVESPTGPGVGELEGVLQSFISTQTKTADYYLSFAISGKISNGTADEVRAIVELLRKKTGDDSIDVAFFRQGSIKVILSGSPEGLERLRELVESGELEELGLPPIEGIERVEGDSEDARKARLVQVLRMRTSDLAFVRARACIQDLEKALTIARARARNLDDAIVLNRARTDELARAIARTLDFTRALARTLARARAPALNEDLDIACKFVRELSEVLAQILDRTSAGVLNRTEVINIVDILDETHGLLHGHKRVIFRTPTLPIFDISISRFELSGTNLSNLDFRDVDFGDVILRPDLTYADVTGTRFGNNPGLTEADKRDLISRGAIFEEPPTSDVESLVLR